MKRIILALSLLLCFSLYTFAQDADSKDSALAELQSAKQQKGLGIGLTVVGGVALLGTYIFYNVDGVLVSNQLVNAPNAQSTQQAETTWAVVSLGGAIIGVCGLAFGIPNIIKGAVKQHHAETELENMADYSEATITPLVGYCPSNSNLSLGMKLSY